MNKYLLILILLILVFLYCQRPSEPYCACGAA